MLVHATNAYTSRAVAPASDATISTSPPCGSTCPAAGLHAAAAHFCSCHVIVRHTAHRPEPRLRAYPALQSAVGRSRPVTRLDERSRRCVLAVPSALLPAFASAQSRHGAQARRRVRARLLCAAALLRGAALLCSLGAVGARRTPNVAPGARLCALPACARRRHGQTHASPRVGGPSSAGCARGARLGTFLELRGVPSRAAAAATTTSSRWSSSATAASGRATCCPASPATSSASSPSRPSVSSSPRAASRHAIH